MSNSPISHNNDLSALVEAGYRVEIRGAYLLVKGIPYVKQNGDIGNGDIVTSLELAGDKTRPPGDHTVWWTGETPHTASGESMEPYLSCGNWVTGQDLGEGIMVYMQWSRKPKSEGGSRGYRDYQEKIETYVEEVGGEAEAKRPGILEAARAGGDPEVESKTRFKYVDTNAYRNGVRGIEQRIEDEVVAVIGVGGSGSYLVDILAKTNIKELYLYDDDILEQHNAFRIAGAARIEELGSGKSKVEWHRERYAAVREEGIYVHEKRVDDETLKCLAKCTTVFIAVDCLNSRRKIQNKCNEMGVLHISVGLGLDIEGDNNDQIGGMVKVETQYRPKDVGKEGNGIQDGEEEQPNQIYGNVQTAELNMLGAALAITEWKAKRGVYRDERPNGTDSILYTVSTGRILLGKKGKG